MDVKLNSSSVNLTYISLSVLGAKVTHPESPLSYCLNTFVRFVV